MKSAFFPLAYVRQMLTWHDGAPSLLPSDRVESTFMLSNVMLSLLLFPPLNALPHEEIVIMASAMVNIVSVAFFMSSQSLLFVT